MSKYTEIESIASNKYTHIKARVKNNPGYKLEDYWKREDFINWYVNIEKKCCYCYSTEEEIILFYNKNNSKRKNTRGKTLEIERIQDKEYSKNNCSLICYWCNNAKSDAFTREEFREIGLSIGKTIQK